MVLSADLHRVEINKSIRIAMCLNFKEKPVVVLQDRKDPSFIQRLSNNTGRGKYWNCYSCCNGKLYSKSFECAKYLLMALFHYFYFVMGKTVILQSLFHLSLGWLVFVLEWDSWKTFTVCKMRLANNALYKTKYAWNMTQVFSMSVVMNDFFFKGLTVL